MRGSIWNGPCKVGIASHLSQCSFQILLTDIGSIGVGFRYIFGELGGELGAIVAIGVVGLPTLGAMLNWMWSFNNRCDSTQILSQILFDI